MLPARPAPRGGDPPDRSSTGIWADLTEQAAADRGDTARNIDAWYPAFDVAPGQRLYLAPPDRVRVW